MPVTFTRSNEFRSYRFVSLKKKKFLMSVLTLALSSVRHPSAGRINTSKFCFIQKPFSAAESFTRTYETRTYISQHRLPVLHCS